MKKIHTDTASNTARRRSIAIAAIAATFLMLIFSLVHHVLATRLEAPVNTITLSPAELERFPLQIGDWVGQNIPMDEAIVRRTDTDALINRRYSRSKASESVGFYIAYGVRARELMPHRPEVCYPGAGWTRTDRYFIDLPLSDGMQLPCRILQFSRGTLITEKVLVLNYYIVDGEYSGDVSLLRSKVWRGSGTVRYAVQVQIVTSVTNNMSADSAAKMLCDFAVESASSIFKLFEEGVKETQLPDNSRVHLNDTFGGTGSD